MSSRWIERGDAAMRDDAAAAASDRASFERLVVCVDDTDDVTKATSTGEIAGLMVDEACAMGGFVRLGITRHQLLLRDDVPYTSHNSSMAFELAMPLGSCDEFRRRAIEVIEANRADASDPGLCIARIPCTEDGGAQGACRRALDALAAFGNRAKMEFCSKESAYGLARSIPWVTLSEHGGDGAGVVGALAGVGLRLGGNDGRFRGKWDFARLCEDIPAPDVGSVAALLSRRLNGAVSLIDFEGRPLDGSIPFVAEREGKPILRNGALTVVCEVGREGARPCRKADLGDRGNACLEDAPACAAFEWDNDIEECLDARVSCRNCLHRRWTSEGFRCVKDDATGAAGATGATGAGRGLRSGSDDPSREDRPLVALGR